MKNYYKPILLIFFLSSFGLFAQWEQLSGIPNSPVYDLLVAQNKIYAVVWDNGIYVSSDYGDNWVQQNEGINTTLLKAIALVDTTMLVGASDTNGVFRSTDNGYHWVRSVDSLTERSVASFAVDGEVVYLLSESSVVFKSTDYGQTWLEVNTSEISNVITSLAVSNGRILLGTNTGDLYLSTDDGKNWTNIKNQQIYSTITALFWDGDNIFCGTTTGVLFSSNLGTNWFQRNLGLKAKDISLFRKINNAIVIGTKTGGLYFSLDEGRNWFEFNEGITNMTILSLAYDKYYIYVGTEYGGILRRNINEMKLPEVTAPVLKYPPNGATNVEKVVNFAWDEVNGAVSYHIMVARDGSFSSNSIIVDKDGITNTFYPSVVLKPNSKYYWKVASVDYQSNEKWSEVYSFETIFEPIKPELYFPFNDFEVTTIPIVFYWSDCGKVDKYQLQVATSNDFQTTLVDINTSDTTYSVSSGIENNRTYFWRVIVYYNDTTKIPSDTFKFRTTVLGVETETEREIHFEQTETSMRIQFIDLQAKELVSVEIFNILGQSVRFGWFESDGGNNLVEIDLGGLSSGFYNLSIRTSSGKRVFKSFVVVK
ncbi:MAG: hypothetical protein CH6_4247 [Candidatus Kapaibacterium sp.]|nr:MAG: hypothetical protein CH6_4247 [Candidatus Kapabacteria bacterium]